MTDGEPTSGGVPALPDSFNDRADGVREGAAYVRQAAQAVATGDASTFPLMTRDDIVNAFDDRFDFIRKVPDPEIWCATVSAMIRGTLPDASEEDRNLADEAARKSSFPLLNDVLVSAVIAGTRKDVASALDRLAEQCEWVVNWVLTHQDVPEPQPEQEQAHLAKLRTWNEAERIWRASPTDPPAKPRRGPETPKGGSTPPR